MLLMVLTGFYKWSTERSFHYEGVRKIKLGLATLDSLKIKKHSHSATIASKDSAKPLATISRRH